MFPVDAPEITSNTPSETKVGVDVGASAKLTCTIDAYPIAKIKWTIKGETQELGGGEYSVTNYIEPQYSDLVVTVQPKHHGMSFICTATNSFGSDTQEFQILSKRKCILPL